MQSAFDGDSLKRLIDKIQEKWICTTYYGGATYSVNLVSWFIQDVHTELLHYIGLDRYDGALQLEGRYLDDKQVAESIDMAQRHWSSSPSMPRHLLSQAVRNVLEDSRRKGKLKDQPKSNSFY